MISVLNRVKSVKTKTMLIILPLVVLVFIAMIGVAFAYSRQIIVKQTGYGMEKQLNGIVENVENSLSAHAKLTETFARTAEARGTLNTLNDYRAMTSRAVDANATTFGLGIFFEPYKHDVGSKYFSTYVYRDGEKKVSTEDYNSPDYDYPNQEWYKIVGPKGVDGIQYSEPYYDERTGVTMVTISVPMFDAKDEFLGVVTGDINLSTIQRSITETKVGDTGWAYLADADGKYLAGKDKQPPSEQSDIRTYEAVVPSAGWQLTIAVTNKELNEPIQGLIVKIAIVGLIGIFIIVAAIFAYSRMIANQIKKVNELSDYMAQGDFTHVIVPDTKDEFGTMSINFNRAMAMIRNLVADIIQVTGNLTTSNKELSVSVNEIAMGNQNQAELVEDVTQKIETMTSGINRVAAHSKEVAESTAEAAERANDGGRIIRNAIGEMSRISDKINELSDNSKQIGDIIEVIEDISSQTNLLALNAAIEAARAGEVGKGFAVVADEVRKLAERSTESTRRIGGIIANIQKQTEASVAAVSEGNEMAKQAASAFEDIIERIHQSSRRVSEIASASKEQSSQSTEVSLQVQSMSAVTEQTSAGAEENAAMAGQLTEMADKLQRLIDKFKV
ncbi:methyl-accepting chemotaxis protein [Cohnella soli]|uniref:Methyl-accepting chemotaxis protein n=1 Tax=Cohnella soli TaxID=425005 RepID=A0ABW0HY78_9BACL